MNIPYVFKKCTKCGEWLVACKVNFRKNKSGKYGLRSECKKCGAEYEKQYREENKDKIKQYYKKNKDKLAERNKQYREENKDYYAEYQKKYWKKYREENKDYYEEYHKQWYEANKDKRAEYKKQWYATPQGQIVTFNNGCRRRLREQNQGDGINKEQWLECMKFFEFRCAYSGEYIGGNNKRNIRSIDHIKPLNRGGKHEIWNLVPMYKPYNSSKNDKDLLEWYREQDFYSEERLQKIHEWQEYAFNKWGMNNE